jgi:hypothetical protein
LATAVINSAGGDDYTTLAAWWTAVRTSGVAETAQVKGGGSVGIVDLDASGTATPTIEPYAGHMHDGTGFDTAKAYIDVGASQVGITAAKSATITGIQVRPTSATATWGILASAGTVTVQNCYVQAISTNKFGAGIVTNGGAPTFKNNAVQGKMDIGIQASGGNGTTLIYNNTVVLDSGATYSAIYVSGTGGNSQTVTVKNNFAYSPSCGETYHFITAGAGVTVTAANNNADTDGSAASFFGSTSDQGSVTAADQLVNLTGNMIVKAGADLINNGADLSGSGVTTDFEGTTRSATPTIGWYEYPAAAATGSPNMLLLGVG